MKCGQDEDLCRFSHFEHDCEHDFKGADELSDGRYSPTCKHCGVSLSAHRIDNWKKEKEKWE